MGLIPGLIRSASKSTIFSNLKFSTETFAGGIVGKVRPPYTYTLENSWGF